MKKNKINEEMEKLLSDKEVVRQVVEQAKKIVVDKKAVKRLESLEKARQVRAENIKKAKKENAQISVSDTPEEKPVEVEKKNATPVCAVPPKGRVPLAPETKIIPMKQGAGFGFFKKLKMVRNPSTSYLVTMLYGNGTMKHFVVLTTKDMFTLNKKKYHLNKNAGWYDINFHQNRLMYHVDYVEPLNKELKIEGDRAFLNLNPENIEPVLGMEYIKVLSQSQTLTKWIKMVLLFVVILLAIGFINTAINIIQSGIFRGLMSSFG